MRNHVDTPAGNGQAPHASPVARWYPRPGPLLRKLLAAIRAPSRELPTCSSCVFFEEDPPVQGLEEYHDDNGTCHKLPPVLETYGVARQGMQAEIPPVYGCAITHATTWCEGYRPGHAARRRYVTGRGVV